MLFAPGFMQCGGPYSDLLRAWASAGYVVAVVNFPRTDCRVGAAAYEPDLVNQPADMSYVLSRLLALNAQPHGAFSGLLNRDEIAAAGQSDGGDTVAALAANACCTDHRLKGVAVLSGAEWPPMPWAVLPTRCTADDVRAGHRRYDQSAVDQLAVVPRGPGWRPGTTLTCSARTTWSLT